MMTQDAAMKVLKHAVDLSIGSAVLMIVLGTLAIVLPAATGVGMAILVAWIVIAGGFVHWIFVVYAFAAEKAGQALWRFLIAGVYVVAGIYLAAHPALTLVTLTLLLGAIFISEGVIRIVEFFQARSLPGSGWILFDAMMTLLLGIVIMGAWPRDSAWAIGTILGINLILSGFTRLMVSVGARRAVGAATSG
jgi:uncharacterized membrane protein HdeD (DUF308 family)